MCFPGACQDGSNANLTSDPLSKLTLNQRDHKEAVLKEQPCIKLSRKSDILYSISLELCVLEFFAPSS